VKTCKIICDELYLLIFRLHNFGLTVLLVFISVKRPSYKWERIYSVWL